MDTNVKIGGLINSLFKMIGASSWDEGVLYTLGGLATIVIILAVVAILGKIYLYIEDLNEGGVRAKKKRSTSRGLHMVEWRQ
jgi:hypothetical protein